ncbi:hypothetical protein SSX86_020744 [Deinandra increscens subsp. villosa]|uniref:Uncharacterized protein n=1 Tax=Deinandra increscens subsp. villosa TaxID=3103831 RepID=A0AAP0CNH1_9ASTR
MQTTSSSFFHPLAPPPGAPFSGKLRHPKSPFLNHNQNQNRVTTMAFKKEGSGGKMVDENMIVLRERIRKVKAEMECGGGDDWLPENWMQWEKTYVYSGGYYSDIFEAVAFLQRFLMDSRPSVALGLVAVFAVGGSTAAMAVLWCLMNSIPGN